MTTGAAAAPTINDDEDGFIESAGADLFSPLLTSLTPFSLIMYNASADGL